MILNKPLTDVFSRKICSHRMLPSKGIKSVV